MSNYPNPSIGRVVETIDEAMGVIEDAPNEQLAASVQELHDEGLAIQAEIEALAARAAAFEERAHEVGALISGRSVVVSEGARRIHDELEGTASQLGAVLKVGARATAIACQPEIYAPGLRNTTKAAARVNAGLRIANDAASDLPDALRVLQMRSDEDADRIRRLQESAEDYKGSIS